MTIHAIAMICVLVLAHTAETMLGFGGTVIAFGLGAHLFPVGTLMIMLVIVALPQSLLLIVQCFRHIEWRMILTRIAPAVLPGAVLGILVRSRADESVLKIVLGVFIIGVSAMELTLLFSKAPRTARRLPVAAGLALLFAGGIFHGLFATGGPLIVYYAGREFPSQDSMRGTLSLVWIVLNAIILADFINAGAITGEVALTTAMIAPGMLAGLVLGSLIRVHDRHFKIFTWTLLLVIGASLIIR